MFGSLLPQQGRPKLGGARLRVFGCANKGCRHFTVAHPWLRKDGIFLESAWLCGSRCFEAAMLTRLRDRMPGEPGTVQRLPRMPFQLLMLQEEVISERVLRDARQLADSDGLSLGKALLAIHAVTDEQLATALAEESGCAFYSLPPQPVAPELVLPTALAMQAMAVTVHGAGDRIVVGFAERLDRGVLAMTEQVTGRRAEGCFITESRWKDQLNVSAAGWEAQNVATPPLETGAAARMILEKASQAHSERVVLSRAGDLVWVRYMRGENFFEDSVLCVPRQSASFAKPGKGFGMRDSHALQNTLRMH